MRINGVEAIAPELWPYETKGFLIFLAEMTVDGRIPSTMGVQAAIGFVPMHSSLLFVALALGGSSYW